MNRLEKTSLIKYVRENVAESNFVMLLHYRGLTDKQLYNLRCSLRSNLINIKIIKNRLVKVAIKGLQLEAISPYLNGPTAICYADDPISLSKIIVQFAKENEALKINIAYLNKYIISKEQIETLSKLESLEQVRSSFLSVLVSSQSKFIRTIQSPASNMVCLINNYSNSK